MVLHWLNLQINWQRYFEGVDCLCSIKYMGVYLNVDFLVEMLIEWFEYV
jgi:hypothetical protein